ncbi:MAG: type IVB secretion system protein IcmX [Legionella sp.]|uniref:type IVB secretion system protein IcmX n=1 Tax=Legionella sp. TaxID=459 RepID=UPI0039E52C09
MKRFSKLALINLFYFSMLPAFADDSTDQYNAQQTATNTQNLVQYLVYLGGYLGYDITKNPSQNNTSISQTLLNAQTLQTLQLSMYNSLFGAIPVDAFSAALTQFAPNQISASSYWNNFANYTFNSQNFSNPSAQQQGNVSVNSGIDQQTFQQDPVSQAVLNILGTPDYSYCMNYDGTTWIGCSSTTSNSGGSLLPYNYVTANVIGTIPSTYQYYTYQYNQQFLGQLNSNVLTSPLMYTTQSASGNTTSSPSTTNQNGGLTAQNQAQQAANFIRYVSGIVTPLPLPNLKDYDTLYSQATPPSSSSTPTLQQVQAQTTLNNYFTTLRTYAAQYSVSLSNLYFIMSKRLPQGTGSSSQSQNQIPMSQALSEFTMATWRLYNPDMSTNNQWINQLNGASSATVEKEIATLLAEISYQMYLDRQIQERILLTNSIMLLQNTRTSQPSLSSSSTATAAASSQ